MDERIEAVKRMQKYIAEHLSEEIGAAELARAAGYSPWHARRLFLQYVGISPADYVRKLRLRKSALLMRDCGAKVLDAAMESGFESADGFQRAFMREYGCNPAKYEREALPIRLYTPYPVLYPKERQENNVMKTKNIFITLVEKPERKVILKRGKKATHYFEYCEEVGCDVWGILTSIKSLTGEPVCLWLPPERIPTGTSEYVQGTEVPTDYAGIVPDGFEVITLPKADYLMFRGEPFAEEDFEQAIAEIWEAEKKYDPALLGWEWDRTNPRYQLEPIGERGYIELLPVKKK